VYPWDVASNSLSELAWELVERPFIPWGAAAVAGEWSSLDLLLTASIVDVFCGRYAPTVRTRGSSNIRAAVVDGLWMHFCAGVLSCRRRVPALRNDVPLPDGVRQILEPYESAAARMHVLIHNELFSICCLVPDTHPVAEHVNVAQIWFAGLGLRNLQVLQTSKPAMVQMLSALVAPTTTPELLNMPDVGYDMLMYRAHSALTPFILPMNVGKAEAFLDQCTILLQTGNRDRLAGRILFLRGYILSVLAGLDPTDVDITMAATTELECALQQYRDCGDSISVLVVRIHQIVFYLSTQLFATADRRETMDSLIEESARIGRFLLQNGCRALCNSEYDRMSCSGLR
jgi:hypothetical protein